MIGKGGELHHNHRADGHGHSVFATFAYKFLEHRGHKAVKTFRTVIGTDEEIVADGSHLLLVDKQVGSLGADDHIDLRSPFVEPLCLGIYRSGTYTARDKYVTLGCELPGIHINKL